MIAILWEYDVRPESLAEFEERYSPQGAWAALFRNAPGYLGTELLRDPNRPQRYLTIDRWHSVAAHEAFLTLWKAEYDRLDRECAGLTEEERYLGRWESISPETR